MPVPTSFDDISTDPTANSPLGTETVGTDMNDYFQAAYSFIKTLYQGGIVPTGAVNLNSQKLTNVATGTVATDGVNFGQLQGYVPLAGGVTLTGQVTFNTPNVTAMTIKAGTATGLIVQSANQIGIEVDGSAGATGGNIKMIDNTGSKTIRSVLNQLQIVNNAFTAGIFTIDDAGNTTANGNVIAFSDERLKENWRDLGDDFVERLANLKAGIFDRIDIKATQVGVGAQSLQEFLPEAVNENLDGVLGVAYGNAALVACVKLAQRVLELERQLLGGR